MTDKEVQKIIKGLPKQIRNVIESRIGLDGEREYRIKPEYVNRIEMRVGPDGKWQVRIKPVN